MKFFFSGGIRLTFTGEDLDVSQNPLISYGGKSVSSPSSSTFHSIFTYLLFSVLPQLPCNASENGNTLTCFAPPAGSGDTILMYTLMLDNAEFRDFTNPNLLVMVLPNPSDFALISNEPIEIGSSTLIRIQVRYLAGR